MGSAITCPKCQQRINLAPPLSGQTAKCPLCKTVFQVSNPNEKSPQSPTTTVPQPVPSPQTYSQSPTPTNHESSDQRSQHFQTGHESYSTNSVPDNQSQNSSVALFLGCGFFAILLAVAIGIIAIIVMM